MPSTPLTAELPQVLRDLTDERARQIAIGYTTQHDDDHVPGDLVALAADRLGAPGHADELTREDLVKVAAMLVAAIEALDREAR